MGLAHMQYERRPILNSSNLRTAPGATVLAAAAVDAVRLSDANRACYHPVPQAVRAQADMPWRSRLMRWSPENPRSAMATGAQPRQGLGLGQVGSGGSRRRHEFAGSGRGQGSCQPMRLGGTCVVTRGDSSGGFGRPGDGLSPGRCEALLKLHCKELPRVRQ
jgi:hypothetical protein